MRLGISSYTFPWAVGVPGYAQPRRRMTAVDLVSEAGRMGATVLQFGDNLPLYELTGPELDELKAAARRLGIAIEVGTRGVAQDVLLNYLRCAQDVDARLVRTLLPRHDGASDVGDVVAALAAVLPAYESAGVVLAVENYELYSAAEFAEILRRLPASKLAMCLDTANNLGRGESLGELIAAFGPRIACLHVKDVRISRLGTRMGFLVEGCPAGQGIVDLTAAIRSLKAAGVSMAELSVILEQWPPEQSNIEQTVMLERKWAEASFEHVQRVAANL